MSSGPGAGGAGGGAVKLGSGVTPANIGADIEPGICMGAPAVGIEPGNPGIVTAPVTGGALIAGMPVKAGMPLGAKGVALAPMGRAATGRALNAAVASGPACISSPKATN